MARAPFHVDTAGWTPSAEWGRVARMTAKAENSRAQAHFAVPSKAASKMPSYDVAVMGRGNSAALTALALADSGFSVWAEAAQAAPDTPNDQRAATWQRVLALSPGARRALEALGVWQRLEAGHAPVADIAVGGPHDRDLPLRFAASPKPSVDVEAADGRPVDILSHIVSLSDLTAAMAGLCAPAQPLRNRRRHRKRHPRHAISTRAPA